MSTKWKIPKKDLKIMGKKYNNLLEKVTDINNLRKAFHLTSKGKRLTTGFLIFKEHLEENLLLLQKEIKEGSYQRGEYYTFEVRDPKQRTIFALPFRDRVVQQAIYLIIEPIFDKTFYYHSYACRKNKGVHNGVREIKSTINKLRETVKEVYYLKIDFRKYFYNIDKTILLKEIMRKIRDKSLLRLIEKFDGFIGVGIAVGNLLSQLFANIYGNIFDRFVKYKLKFKHYFRYVDDSVFIDTDKNELQKIKRIVERFCSLYMKMKFSKWYIDKIERKPLNFLGYRISYKYILLRKRSVIASRRKIKFYIKTHQKEKLKRFIASWKGHLQWANTFNLKQTLNKQHNAWRIIYQ